MGAVKIKDSDEIRRLDTSHGVVFYVQYAISSSQALTKDRVIKMFPDVFNDSISTCKGEYHIRLNESAKPMQHAPRRGQIDLRNKVKAAWF